MAMDPATLLQTVYKAFREHRLADMLANFADDFRMAVHLPEEAVPGGDKQRNNQIAALHVGSTGCCLAQALRSARSRTGAR